MKKHTAALAASVLACGALTAATQAQQTPPPGSGAGGGLNMRRLPIALGQVTAINAAAGTVTITSQLGGDSQTLQVSGTTTINTQTDATIADLKVGDQVSVTGVPTAITASQITIGQMPGMAMGGGRGQGAGGAQGAAGGGARAGGARAGGPGGAQASGKVVSLSPLTISLGPDATLTLKMAPDAKVSKISPLPLSGLKVGDRVMASGQPGADGVFAATSLGVNMTGGMMGGMRGLNGMHGQGGANGQRRQRRNPNGAGGTETPPPATDPNANPPQ